MALTLQLRVAVPPPTDRALPSQPARAAPLLLQVHSGEPQRLLLGARAPLTPSFKHSWMSFQVGLQIRAISWHVNFGFYLASVRVSWLLLPLYVQILHLTSGTHARSWKTPAVNCIKYNLTNMKVQVDLFLLLSACMGIMK